MEKRTFPSFFLGIKYKLGLVFILFIGLNVGSVIYTHQFHSLKKHDSTIINIAGAQRMLSQKMTKESLLLFNGEGQREELELSVERFDRALYNLIYGNEELGIPKTKNQEILRELYNAQYLWDDFRQELEVILHKSTELKGLTEDPEAKKALSFIVANNDLLLEQMDGIVSQYEKQAKSEVDMLSFLTFMFVLLNIVIVFLGFKIINPIGKIVHKLHAIANGNFLLKKLKITSSDEFGQLANDTNKMIDLINKLLEQKQKQEEAITRTEKLSVLGQLSAGIAHEIRNPLTSLKGFLYILRTDPKQEFIDIMEMEIERINQIVDEFMVLSKPISKDFQKGCLNETVEDVVTIIDTHGKMYNIDIATQFANETSLANYNENQIKQVLVNFLKNSIEAMPNGGTITVSVTIVEDFIKILIKDEGMGIPKEMLEKLGEPFFTTKEQGTGLGLMISFKIIEEHNGTVTIDSEVGKGTTVVISLPKYE